MQSNSCLKTFQIRSLNHCIRQSIPDLTNTIWKEIPHKKGNFGGKGRPLLSIVTFCGELCRSGWTDRFAAWVVDSGGPKEAQLQLYLPGGANVPTWEGTLAPPCKYDRTIRLWRWCGLMSNYFNHLLLLLPDFHSLLIDASTFFVMLRLCLQFIA